MPSSEERGYFLVKAGGKLHVCVECGVVVKTMQDYLMQRFASSVHFS